MTHQGTRMIPISRRSALRTLLRGALAPVALAAVGCGYTIRPPYNNTIQTVYVPIFRTVSSFRRDINLRLTEEVIKQIELQTPYKVVATPEEADYVLACDIVLDQRNSVIQNPNNLPRQSAHTITVAVWFFPSNHDPDPQRPKEAGDRITEFVNNYSELGETVTAAYDKAVIQLARQIVGKMEVPW